jgi:hypothetical protein
MIIITVIKIIIIIITIFLFMIVIIIIWMRLGYMRDVGGIVSGRGNYKN